MMESNSKNVFINKLNKYHNNLGILWVRDTLTFLTYSILLTQNNLDMDQLIPCLVRDMVSLSRD